MGSLTVVPGVPWFTLGAGYFRSRTHSLILNDGSDTSLDWAPSSRPDSSYLAQSLIDEDDDTTQDQRPDSYSMSLLEQRRSLDSLYRPIRPDTPLGSHQDDQDQNGQESEQGFTFSPVGMSTPRPPTAAFPAMFATPVTVRPVRLITSSSDNPAPLYLHRIEIPSESESASVSKSEDADTDCLTPVPLGKNRRLPSASHSHEGHLPLDRVALPRQRDHTHVLFRPPSFTARHARPSDSFPFSFSFDAADPTARLEEQRQRVSFPAGQHLPVSETAPQLNDNDAADTVANIHPQHYETASMLEHRQQYHHHLTPFDMPHVGRVSADLGLGLGQGYDHADDRELGAFRVQTGSVAARERVVLTTINNFHTTIHYHSSTAIDHHGNHTAAASLNQPSAGPPPPPPPTPPSPSFSAAVRPGIPRAGATTSSRPALPFLAELASKRAAIEAKASARGERFKIDRALEEAADEAQQARLREARSKQGLGGGKMGRVGE